MVNAKKKVKKLQPSCESCEHYDWDEELQEYVCMVDMDEDDAYRFHTQTRFVCSYYKYYDEYKSVQKQN